MKVETSIEVKQVKPKFPLSDVFTKIDKKGCAKCKLCAKEIHYASRGLHALLAHCQTGVHTQRFTNIITTQSVAQLLRRDEDSALASTNAAEKIRESAMPKLPVAMCDRISNAEVDVHVYVCVCRVGCIYRVGGSAGCICRVG